MRFENTEIPVLQQQMKAVREGRCGKIRALFTRLQRGKNRTYRRQQSPFPRSPRQTQFNPKTLESINDGRT